MMFLLNAFRRFLNARSFQKEWDREVDEGIIEVSRLRGRVV